MEVVTCSAQATAQLTAEVSDYDTQVCNGNIRHFQLSLFAFIDNINIALISQVCRGGRCTSAVISVTERHLPTNINHMLLLLRIVCRRDCFVVSVCQHKNSHLLMLK